MSFLLALAFWDTGQTPTGSRRIYLDLYEAPAWVQASDDFPSGGSISIAKPRPPGSMTEEEFARQIRLDVAPGLWSEEKGWTLQVSGGGVVVRAPQRIHRAIREYLARVRS